MKIHAALAMVLALALATATFAQNQADSGFQPKAVGKLVGKFKPITEIPVVSATETDLRQDELVLGVELNGQARAYPINMLTGPKREILNDVLGEQAIAATW